MCERRRQMRDEFRLGHGAHPPRELLLHVLVVELGFEQGAKYANPKAEVFSNMTGTTPAAWNDPTRGGELAKAQFAKGADVIFAAAGGTGMGVYQAAKDAGVEITGYARVMVGEGVEKKEEDFAAEVAKMVQG